ncbi:MAG: hypothetical protein P4L34_09720 [Paludibacter sp.]|nr:hypothetical protein [Paludibacter sp.]
MTMLLNMLGKPVTTVHKICISNYIKDKFITTMPSLQWTDNFNLACCFDNELEVHEFADRNAVQNIIGDELELYIWSDTRKSIYETVEL